MLMVTNNTETSEIADVASIGDTIRYWVSDDEMQALSFIGDRYEVAIVLRGCIAEEAEIVCFSGCSTHPTSVFESNAAR